MKWGGKKPLVLGTIDDDDKVEETITIQPGEEIPPKWVDAYKQAKVRYELPRFEGEPGDGQDAAIVEHMLKQMTPWPKSEGEK